MERCVVIAQTLQRSRYRISRILSDSNPTHEPHSEAEDAMWFNIAREVEEALGL
jgi:hypothetical protein